MTDAEKAYQIAEERIERVKREGLTSLNLSPGGFTADGVTWDDEETLRNLATLPPAIADLTDLTRFDLNHTQVADISPLAAMTAMRILRLTNTQVADISPLAAMTAMQRLYLTNTQVTDLRPISDLDSLIEGAKEGRFFGLYFSHTPATRIDPDGLGRMSEIEDDEQRTRETLAYLKGLTHWPPGEPAAPDQDAELNVVVTEGGAEVSAGHPDADEAKDRVKRACHDQLRDASEAFGRVAENRHMNVAKRGWRLADLLSVDFADLDMLLIHMELEDLRNLYLRRDERLGEEALTPDEIDAISRVLTIGPGLVRDNEDVEAFETRANQLKDEPPVPEQVEAEDRIMAAIRAETDLMGETMRGYAERAEGAADNANAAVRKALSKNTPIGLGQYMLAAGAAGLMGTAASTVAADSAVWLYQFQEPLMIIAKAQGAAFEHWLGFVLEHIRQNLPAARLPVRSPKAGED